MQSRNPLPEGIALGSWVTASRPRGVIMSAAITAALCLFLAIDASAAVVRLQVDWAPSDG